MTLKNDFQPCETEKLNQAKSLMFQQGRVEGRGHDRKRQAQTKPNIFRGTLTAAALGKHIYIHTYKYVCPIHILCRAYKLWQVIWELGRAQGEYIKLIMGRIYFIESMTRSEDLFN